MTHPTYGRDKARQLRTERHLSIVETAERLALPKRRSTTGSATCRWAEPGAAAPRANAKLVRRCRLEREAAYAQGRLEFPALAADPTFRDFVCMYIGEGSKRGRNRVAVANSDPAVIDLCARWIRRFARNPVTFRVQYHADQDLRELTRFWSARVGVPSAEIRLQRKSNSGKLGGRNWRSRYGVLTVTAGDTLLRSRLQGWIDCLREQWLHSLSDGA